MAREIERKFLLRDDGWRAAVEHSEHLRQGYLAGTPHCSVRVRIGGDAAHLNIKSATLGIEREEFEYPIPLADAETMLRLLCGGRTLDKTRHTIHHGGYAWEVDEFHGANQGLVVAEIELPRVDAEFSRPAWLGAEVSSDPRYYNTCLAEHPYDTWSDGPIP